MRLVVKAIIKGVSKFRGAIDGQDIDSGAVFIEEPFDASNANAKGFRTVEYKAVNSEVVGRVFHLEFPITAEVTMEMSATKRGNVIVVHEVKPIGLATGQPAANPKQAA